MKIIFTILFIIIFGLPYYSGHELPCSRNQSELCPQDIQINIHTIDQQEQRCDFWLKINIGIGLACLMLFTLVLVVWVKRLVRKLRLRIESDRNLQFCQQTCNIHMHSNLQSNIPSGVLHHDSGCLSHYEELSVPPPLPPPRMPTSNFLQTPSGSKNNLNNLNLYVTPVTKLCLKTENDLKSNASDKSFNSHIVSFSAKKREPEIMSPVNHYLTILSGSNDNSQTFLTINSKSNSVRKKLNLDKVTPDTSMCYQHLRVPSQRRLGASHPCIPLIAVEDYDQDATQLSKSIV